MTRPGRNTIRHVVAYLADHPWSSAREIAELAWVRGLSPSGVSSALVSLPGIERRRVMRGDCAELVYRLCGPAP